MIFFNHWLCSMVIRSDSAHMYRAGFSESDPSAVCNRLVLAGFSANRWGVATSSDGSPHCNQRLRQHRLLVCSMFLIRRDTVGAHAQCFLSQCVPRQSRGRSVHLRLVVKVASSTRGDTWSASVFDACGLVGLNQSAT